MQYKFPMTLDKQFKDKLEQLHSKYGSDMMSISGMSPQQLDICDSFAKFIKTDTVADATIDDNANVSDKNINTMMAESVKPMYKLLSRNKLYVEMKEEFGIEVANDFLEHAINGTIYEHDSFDSSFKPYCYSYSLENIVDKGLFFIDDMKANAPKHWDTFNHHVLEFISYATNQASGAVGIPDYLVYAYYFYMKDSENMSDKEREKLSSQKFQEFVFSLNQPYLKSGIQSAYTNVSILDLDHLAKFFSDKDYPDGSSIMSHIDGILEFQQMFLDYVGELRKIKWHTFPVISASLIFKDGEYQDEDTAKMVVNHNWKFGFNDVNIMNVEEVTSSASCCRLVLDLDEISETSVFNSIGGSDLNVGSSKVVTLNLVRLAMNATLNHKDDVSGAFKEMIEAETKLIHKYHYAHRNQLIKNVSNGLLPLYSHNLMNLNNQFATIGINGVFEAIDILGGIDYDEDGNAKYSDEGFKIAEMLFDVILTENKNTKKLYGFMSNVEQIPAESASVKLVKKDKLFFGKRLTSEFLGEDCTIYGNQWIPLKQKSKLFDRIDSAKLDNYCGGGAIIHINLGENFNSFDDAWEFTNGLANKGVKYFSYISIIDLCEHDHSFFGDICPICNGKSVTKGIKIVGYLVKQDSYKSERKQEIKERKFYSVNK